MVTDAGSSFNSLTIRYWIEQDQTNNIQFLVWLVHRTFDRQLSQDTLRYKALIMNLLP